jgi:hypothetical protein
MSVDTLAAIEGEATDPDPNSQELVNEILLAGDTALSTDALATALSGTRWVMN